MLKVYTVVGCVVLAVCCGCSPTSPRIKEISGVAVVSGAPLPESSTLTFSLVDQDSGFTTRVGKEGHYRYIPASSLTVSPGRYKVTVSPPGAKAIMIHGVPGPDPSHKDDNQIVPPKYRSKETTPLEVEIGVSPVQFDIHLEP